MADPEPFLTDAMFAELLLQLRADRVRKREFVSSLTEGVVLAVEQVQEVRLASLEAGPETSGTGLVADAFWGFLFDSGINVLWTRVLLGGFLKSMEKLSLGLLAHELHMARAAKAGRESFESLKSLRSALYQTEKSGADRGAGTASRSMAGRLTNLLSKLDEQQFDNSGAFRQGTIDIRALLDEEIGKASASASAPSQSRTGTFAMALFARDLRVRYDGESEHASEVAVGVEQLLNATRAYLGGSTAESGGTPAVNMLASAYDWASRQRQQLELMSDQLEIAMMQSRHRQSAAGVCLVLGVTSDSVPMDLGEVRSRSWLLSEAVVWAEVYRDHLCGRTAVDTEDDVLIGIGIPQRTVTYLEKRFAADARKWIVSPSSSTTLVPTGTTGGATIQRATAANSTPMSDVRTWAAKRLLAARGLLPLESTLVSLKLTAEERAQFRKSKVDSYAVAAFLLGMLNCYQQNAGVLLDQVTQISKDLKS